MKNAKLILIMSLASLISCSGVEHDAASEQPVTGTDALIYRVANFEYDELSDHNVVPEAGYVSKPEVAAKIAEAVAVDIYGRKNIEKQRPYLVKRFEDRWVVLGTFPHGPYGKGGVFEIEVSSADGKILRMTHGK